MEKFQDGDRVKMTAEAAEVNSRARSFTGVVVGRARDADCVRVRRDGQTTVMVWHESAWEPLNDGDTDDN